MRGLNMNEKFLVFDIWADYAHFKKPYTTTSPLTFSIPPRTVITGIVSAITGFQKDKYHDVFTKELSKIAVSIIKPIKKVRISENLLNTKKSFNVIHERTQIKIEFLKDPSYRFYISHKDRVLFEKIKDCLYNHNSVYSVSLGLSENLANFKYIGEYEAKEELKPNDFIEIASTIPVIQLSKGNVDFTREGEYFTEIIPLEMDNERKVKEYGEVLFERTCNSILSRPGVYYKLLDLGENIVPL